MAKQTSAIKLSGSISNVTYYQLNGKTYARKKSSLTKRKIMTSERSEPTRILMDNMKLASPTASFYYQSLSPGRKQVKRYRKMVAVAQHLLAEGNTIEKVHATLKKMRDEFENKK